jgi:hypothetical protein
MDENRCYVQLYFYDKLSSLRPSDMSDLSIEHVRDTMFDSIRHETCMILRGNLALGQLYQTKQTTQGNITSQ